MSETTTTKQRIDQRLTALGMSKSNLARILGQKLDRKILPQYINNFTARDSIPAEYLPAMASILKCSQEWLLTGDNKFLGMVTEINANQIVIPIFDMQTGLKMSHSNLKDALTINQSWFRESTGLEPFDSYVIIMPKGDSMQPTIKQGDLVVVDTADQATIDGLFYVETTQPEIKRISFMSDSVSLISDNSRYPVKQLKLADLRILGRVKFVFGGARF